MEEITSKENKLVKEYIKLNNSKQYRYEKKEFVLEGVKLLCEAYNSNVKIERLFVTKACLQKNESKLSEVVAGTKAYFITGDVEKKLAAAKTPQGVYAVCKMLDNENTVDKIYNSGKYIMLCDLQDTGNVGTIIRTAEAVGIDGVIVSKNTCDIYSLKVIRGSMGSVFRVPFYIADDINETVSLLNENGIQTIATVPDSTAEDITHIGYSVPTVALIGNEGNGLDESVAMMCKKRGTIKMHGKTESLNASVAACILMWEMTK